MAMRATGVQLFVVCMYVCVYVYACVCVCVCVCVDAGMGTACFDFSSSRPSSTQLTQVITAVVHGRQHISKTHECTGA